MTNKVSIIIVNWNGRDILEQCLSSLEKTDYCDFKIVVVDNGSIDDSVQFIKQNWEKVDLIALKKNYGYAKANNIGIKFALKKYNPDFFLLLNNDTEIVQKDWLKKMVEVASLEKETGILGCKLIFPDGKIQYLGTKITSFGFTGIILRKKNLPEKLFKVDAIIGAVFLIKRVVIEKIGFLDEGYSPFLTEDMDYCVRTRKAGYKVKVLPEISVIHHCSQSMKKKEDDFLWFVTKKNNIRFVFLHLGFVKILVYVFYDFFLSLPYEMLEKKDAGKIISPMNVKIKQNWVKRVVLFLKAYFENLKSAQEIVKTRRKSKLWH